MLYINFFFLNVVVKNLFFFYKLHKSINFINIFKEICLYILENFFFRLVLHLKLSSFWGSRLQLIDFVTTQLATRFMFLLCLIFCNILYNFYTFVNILTRKPDTNTKDLIVVIQLPSIERLFYNAEWLEREVMELLGIAFFCKYDTRNLLLEFTNIFKPLLKSYPSIGFFELFFDMLRQIFKHFRISIQL